MSDTQQHSNAAYLYAFFMSIFGAASAAALKLISADVAVEFITFLQFAISLLVSLYLVYHRGVTARELFSIEKDDRVILVIRGLAGLLGFYAFYMSITRIPLVDATLLRHSSPLFVPVLAFAWFRLRTSPVTIIFILLGFAGVYIALQPDFYKINPFHLLGLASGACLATSMVTTNRLKKYSSTTVLFYYFLIGFIGMLPLGIIHWQSVNLFQAAIILFIGFSIFIAMYLYNKAFTLSSAAVVSPMTYLSVVHAGILGWLIWGYVPSLLSMTGMAVVACCGIATTLLGGFAQRR